MRKDVLPTVAMVMIVSVMFFTAACAKKNMQSEPVSAVQPELQKPQETTAEADVQVEKVLENRMPSKKPAKEITVAFASENIHFDFDSSDLSAQAKQILSSNAEFLRINSDTTVTVEGHCDERGTEKYNIDLGQRRAESVKNFLVEQGVSNDRLATVSYGEEKQIALGKNEDSWAKNRRVQIVVN